MLEEIKVEAITECRNRMMRLLNRMAYENMMIFLCEIKGMNLSIICGG